MQILTPRLLLRRARPDDLEAMHAVLSDARATRWWSTPPHPDLQTTSAWLNGMISSPPEQSEDFVVEREGRVIGKAGFYRLPEVGYILGCSEVVVAKLTIPIWIAALHEPNREQCC